MDELINLYNEAFKTFGDDTKSVLWTKGHQDLRFEFLVKPFGLKNIKSILDHGCGLAHLKDYLDRNNYRGTYTGSDINKLFLEQCSKKYPDSNFVISKSLKKSEETFDVIVSSGAYNIKYVEDEVEHEKIVFNELKELFERCNIGLSVNFMTDYVDYKQKNAYHQNIERLMNFVRNELGKRFIINQSYMPYEYTISVYKDEETDTNIYAN